MPRQLYARILRLHRKLPPTQRQLGEFPFLNIVIRSVLSIPAQATHTLNKNFNSIRRQPLSRCALVRNTPIGQLSALRVGLLQAAVFMTQWRQYADMLKFQMEAGDGTVEGADLAEDEVRKNSRLPFCVAPAATAR